MDPRLYLSLARALLDRVKRADGLTDPTGRAECRSAISRAYYASFHVAVAFLSFLRIKVCDSGLCHVVTRNGLNNSGESDLQSISSYLGTLYAERRFADYEMNNQRAERLAQAKLLVQLADDTIALLDACRTKYAANPGQGIAVANAILQWANLSGQGHNLSKKP
jgi:uncharacterized protein (UPF0332 family)